MKRQYQIDQQRAVQQFRQLAREENPNLQMIFPMTEVVGLLQEGVGHLMREAGLALMSLVMEEEVRHLAGERHEQHPARMQSDVAAGPVSRILSAGLLSQDGHSSGPSITAGLKRPTRRFDAPSRHVQRPRPPASSLFGLAPCGVCHARCITAAAVRSYRTFSPLPCCQGGIFSVALAVEWT